MTTANFNESVLDQVASTGMFVVTALMVLGQIVLSLI
jgi:hypothetical protein